MGHRQEEPRLWAERDEPVDRDAGDGPAWRSRQRPLLIRGDCLEVMRGQTGSQVDLIYADPPFDTGRRQRIVRADEAAGATKGAGAGDAADAADAAGDEVDVADAGDATGRTARGSEPDGARSSASRAAGGFEDRWASAEEYVAFMRPRLEECHRLLRPQGAILLHCDWRHSHRLRLLLEEIFGPERFVNHLIWRYGLGGSSPRRFARKHDDILYYAKGEEHWFDPPRVPATSRRMQGQDKKATDVLDVPSINNMARERCGWPTQKPVTLLRLLIAACCPPGGLVLDPFCGSGTTLVAAIELGRQAVGIDASEEALALAERRLGAGRAAGGGRRRGVGGASDDQGTGS